jgi:hypothetical protein
LALKGSIYDDSAIWRLKDEYISLLMTEMRISGYVMRLDIVPDFTIEYNENIRAFDFELSIYGIYVGKRKSEWIFGVDGARGDSYTVRTDRTYTHRKWYRHTV